jgi:hypothetical protein
MLVAGFSVLCREMTSEGDIRQREINISNLIKDKEFGMALIQKLGYDKLLLIAQLSNDIERVANNPSILLDIITDDELKERAIELIGTDRYRERQVAQVGFAVNGPGHSMAHHMARLNQGGSHAKSISLDGLILYNMKSTRNFHHVDESVMYQRPLSEEETKQLIEKAKEEFNSLSRGKKYETNFTGKDTLQQAHLLGYYPFGVPYCKKLDQQKRVCYLLFKFMYHMDNSEIVCKKKNKQPERHEDEMQDHDEDKEEEQRKGRKRVKQSDRTTNKKRTKTK